MAKFKTHIYKAGTGGHLRITLEPAQPIFKEGKKIGDQPGKYAEFVGGTFETDDNKVIEKLRSLPTFGTDFFEASEDEEAQLPVQSEEVNLESLTKQELLSRAREKGTEVSESLTKAEIIERLKA